MLFELNQHKHKLLVDVLETALSTLREEIYKTEAADFEQTLKRREALLTAVLHRLQAAAVSSLSIGEPTAAS